jgi:hypothetical protein
MRRQRFAQDQAGPKQASFHGGYPQAKRRSGLRAGKLLDIAQH